jgi:hypothetical protein
LKERGVELDDAILENSNATYMGPWQKKKRYAGNDRYMRTSNHLQRIRWNEKWAKID